MEVQQTCFLASLSTIQSILSFSLRPDVSHAGSMAHILDIRLLKATGSTVDRVHLDLEKEIVKMMYIFFQKEIFLIFALSGLQVSLTSFCMCPDIKSIFSMWDTLVGGIIMGTVAVTQPSVVLY